MSTAYLLEAVARDVWTRDLRKNAEFRVFDDPLRIAAWRPQGDVYRWYASGLPPVSRANEHHVIKLLDAAINECINGLPSLTISEALEAGERRRSPDRYPAWSCGA